jgi:hypothetical protein
VTWADIVTGDTITTLPVAAQAAVAGAVQFGGTFGGATVGLQVSNDGVTYFDMKDLAGATVAATANALFEFTTSAMFLRPVVTGGAANAIDVTVVLRG